MSPVIRRAPRSYVKYDHAHGDQHHNPVAESDQKEDVDEQPGQPREKAGNMNLAEVGDGGGAADRRQISLVPIIKRYAGSRSRSRRIFLAAALPCCMAAGATPGTGLPFFCFKAARSPMTKTSLCPGMLKSGFTTTRPARSTGAPNFLPNGEARYSRRPQHHRSGNLFFPDMNRSRLNLVTTDEVWTSTPRWRNCSSALRERSSG